MKNIPSTISIIVIATLAATGSINAQSVDVNFVNAAERNAFNSLPANPANWQFQNSIGTNSSGGIAPGTSSAIGIWPDTAFNATGFSDVTLSMDFQWDGTVLPTNGFFIGFTSGDSDTYSSTTTTSGTDFRLRLGAFTSGPDTTFQLIASDNGTGVGTRNSTQRTAGWYRLELKVDSVDSVNNEFDDVRLVLRQLDSAGNQVGGALVNSSIGNVAASISADDSVYAYFGGVSGKGITAIDNFTVTATAAIPEPGTYALISGAFALGWIMVRRRPALS